MELAVHQWQWTGTFVSIVDSYTDDFIVHEITTDIAENLFSYYQCNVFF